MRFIPDLGPVQDAVSAVYVPDAVDRKLLLALAANARASIAQLAKDCRIKRDTVTYRLRRLLDQDVLVGTRALIDTGKLGYDAYHVFLKLRNPPQSIEQQMIARVSKMPFVRAVLKFFGKYDYEIALVATSVADFDEKLTLLIEQAGVYLQSYEVLVITQSFVARSFPRSFGVITPKPVALTQSKKLDSTDMAVLSHVADDARISVTDISKSTKIPIDTILYHLRALQQWLVIGYSPVINYGVIGYSVYAVLLDIAQLGKEKEHKLKEFLRTHEHVLWAVKTVGATNVLVYVCVRHEREYHDTISALRNAFPEQIRGFESLSAVAQYKYTIVPQVLFDSNNARR